MLLGVLAALLACAIWGTAFVAPSLAAPFSVFDFSMARSTIMGLLCLASMPIIFRGWPILSARIWMTALFLGFISFPGYHLAIAYGGLYAGPAYTALVIGTTPLVVAGLGNLRDRTMPWRALGGPLLLIALGLGAMNLGALTETTAARPPDHVLLGLLFSLAALGFWVFFAFANADSEKLAGHVSSMGWTVLQGLGALLGAMVLIPIGSLMGLSHWPRDSLFSTAAQNMWLIALFTAFTSSYVGTMFWIYGSRRMPLALSGQIIVFESLFAMLYAFLLEGRWPLPFEWSAIALSMAGVIWGIHLFTRRKAAIPI
jgi:drug/metabolite transporter (DMT)-like permease